MTRENKDASWMPPPGDVIPPEDASPDGVSKRGMGAAAFAVRYPVTISMFFLGIIMLGWISLNKLPTNLFPDLRAPRITVKADAPGLAPQEIERIVVEPLEGRLTTIKGVDQVSSVSRADSGAIIIDFAWGTDMDFALLEVKKNVQGTNIEEVEEIQTLRYDPNALPIMTLGLYSNRGLEEVRYLAYRTIGPALERLPGVARAEVTGGLIPEMKCQLDPELLHFYGLTLSNVAQAIDQANVSASGGWVEEGNQRYMIRAVGEIKNLDQVVRTVVGYSSGVPIYLTDLGEVTWGFQEPVDAVHMDGHPGVGISLYKEAGSNTVEVVRTVREFLGQDKTLAARSAGASGAEPSSGGPGGWVSPTSEPSLIPQDVTAVIAYDQSLFINQAISEVKSNAIQGSGLAALVLLLFLRNIRSTLIVALSIPVSVLATFNLMYFMGLSLNIMTLGGLALGCGMLVDNAIVVVENIFRRRQLGDSPHQAARTGAGEVASAIASSTLTTVVVFLPIAYMGGVTAQLFKEQALTVVFSLMASLVVALMMIPALCSRFLRQVRNTEEEYTGFYPRFLRWTLRRRALVAGVVVLLCLSCYPLVDDLKQEFIPQAAESQFIIKLRMPAGTRLESTERAAKIIEGWLSQDLGENIEHIFTRIGPKPEDTGAVDEEPEGSHTAEMMVSLRKGAALTVPQIIEYLEPRAVNISGLEMTFLLSQTSLATLIGSEKAAIIVEIRGRSLETLTDVALQVKNRMDLIDEVTNVRTTILEGNPEVHLIPDRILMNEYGLDQQQLITLVQSQLRGLVATSLQDVDQTKDVRVQLGDGKMNLPELLDTLIPTGTGRAVTLGTLVQAEIKPGPREIIHRGQERIARVLADVAENQKLSDAVASVQRQIGAMQLPPGYYIRFGGEEERRQDSFERLQFALILALILVYMVMASLFESLMHPFVIMFTMPLGAIGVIWAFYLTGQTLNLMGYIGIIMLAGIVVNNAIVLVDYINYLRRDMGQDMTEAIVHAGCRRLRPIFMTTLTTVMGLLPLALGFGEGAEIRAPMAVAVIGGMVTSTILTLVIIPIVYATFEDALAAVKRFFAFLGWRKWVPEQQEI